MSYKKKENLGGKIRQMEVCEKKKETLILVASAAKPVAADKSPRSPTAEQSSKIFVSILERDLVICGLGCSGRRRRSGSDCWGRGEVSLAEREK